MNAYPFAAALPGRILLVLILLALILALPLFAAEPPRRARPVFSVHDLDRYGFLDRGEFERLLADWRSKRPGRGPRARPLDLAAVDRDRDERIGEEELLLALPSGQGRAGDCAAGKGGAGGGTPWRGGR